MDRVKINNFLLNLKVEIYIFLKIIFHLISIATISLTVFYLTLYQIRNENFGFLYVIVTYLLVCILSQMVLRFSVHTIAYKLLGQEQLAIKKAGILKKSYTILVILNIICSLLIYTSILNGLNNQRLKNWDFLAFINLVSLVVSAIVFLTCYGIFYCKNFTKQSEHSAMNNWLVSS